MAAVKYYIKTARTFRDLQNLLEISKSHFTKLTLEALVVTGFEECAREECIEKFGKKCNVYTSIGRIYFNTTINNYAKFKELKCVDRVNVLVGYTEIHLGGAEEDKNEDLKKIQSTVNVFDWEKALLTWKEVFNFRGNIFPTRKEYEEAIKQNPQKQIKEFEEVIFKSENLNYEKTDLEKALDSVVDSDSDEEVQNGHLENDANTIPRFRVTCNRTGTNHSFSSQEAATVFGGELQDKYNWIVDLSNYDLEIILNITCDNIYACIALNKESNHKRNITHIGPLTLRATICANLLRLCEIKPGEIVIDPMCGGGSIIIEGCINSPTAYFFGGDENASAVNRTKNNINSLKKNYKIDALHWDATILPLKDNSVDVFVSDFPFGKKCGSTTNNKKLYKQALNELARLLRLNTGRCVILTSDRKSLEMAVSQLKSFFKIKQFLNVNIGGLSAFAVVLNRTGEEFVLKLSRKELKCLAAKEYLRRKNLENEVLSIKDTSNGIKGKGLEILGLFLKERLEFLQCAIFCWNKMNLTFRILIMGTQDRLGVNIHIDQLMDRIANNCPNLERLELRWDPENLRFSDKSQKAIDIIRVKCLKLSSLVLSDGRYYEIVKANFERADRLTVVRTTTSCRTSLYYLLTNYKDLIFN